MKSYEKAAAQVVLFNNSDVITTSGNYYCKEPARAAVIVYTTDK